VGHESIGGSQTITKPVLQSTFKGDKKGGKPGWAKRPNRQILIHRHINHVIDYDETKKPSKFNQTISLNRGSNTKKRGDLRKKGEPY